MEKAGNHPYFHGFYRKGVDLGSSLSNYIAAYIFLTRCAINGSRSGVSRTGINSTLATTTINEMDSILIYIENNANGTIPQDENGTSYVSVMNNYSASTANLKLLYWGFALHTLTDTFAHSCYYQNDYYGWSLINHNVNPSTNIPYADDTTYINDRFNVAKAKAKVLLSRKNSNTSGSYSDFIPAYYSTFKIANLYSYAFGACTTGVSGSHISSLNAMNITVSN